MLRDFGFFLLYLFVLTFVFIILGLTVDPFLTFTTWCESWISSGSIDRANIVVQMRLDKMADSNYSSKIFGYRLIKSRWPHERGNL